MNSAAMNICIYVSVGYIYLQSCIAGSQSNSNLLRNYLDCFPKWLQYFMFPPASIQRSNFSMSSLTLTLVSEDQSSRTMSLVNHPGGGEEVSHVICIALMTNEVKLILRVPGRGHQLLWVWLAGHSRTLLLIYQLLLEVAEVSGCHCLAPYEWVCIQ